jgi:hypothetical protein
MSEPELYREMYGTLPDTNGAHFRVFCLALYICSKRRNRNQKEDHLDLLERKFPSVRPVIEEIKRHAEQSIQRHKTKTGHAR